MLVVCKLSCFIWHVTADLFLFCDAQVVVVLAVTAVTPFVNPPRLNLGYTLGAGAPLFRAPASTTELRW